MIRFDKKQKNFKNLFFNINSLKNADNKKNLEIVYKVWKAKELLAADAAKETSVYNLMKENGFPKGELCVDAKEANYLYNVISELDDRAMLDLLCHLTSAVKVGQELMDKFKETVLSKSGGNRIRILIPDIECYGSNLLDFMAGFDNDVSFSLATDNYIVFEICVKLLKKYRSDLRFYNVGFYPDDDASMSLVKGHCAVMLLPFKKFTDEDDALYRLDLNDLYRWVTLLTDQRKPAMVIVPMSFFLSRTTGYGRGEFAKGGILKEISTIPASLLGLRSMAKFGLFITDRFDTGDLTVRKYTAKNGRLFAEGEAVIKKDAEFIVNSDRINGWNVDKWLNVLKNTSKYMFNDKKPLNKMIEVIRGKNFRSDRSGSTPVKIVNISDIEDGSVNKNIEPVEADLSKGRDYVLKKDDLVMTIKGTTIKIAVFNNDDGDYIASPNLCVIRLKPSQKKELDVTYLKMYFDLPCGREQLQSIRSGSIVMNISKEDLLELEIPVPDYRKQTDLCRKYEEGYKRYKNDLDEVEKKWKELQENILKEL